MIIEGEKKVEDVNPNKFFVSSRAQKNYFNFYDELIFYLL
jgi:hypothetical protein